MRRDTLTTLIFTVVPLIGFCQQRPLELYWLQTAVDEIHLFWYWNMQEEEILNFKLLVDGHQVATLGQNKRSCDLSFDPETSHLICLQVETSLSREALEECVEVSLHPPPPGQVPFIRGDLNEDGRIDIADVISWLSILFSIGPDPHWQCQDGADINDDGELNIADPIYLLQYLFAAGPSPHPPFSRCEYDWTKDNLTCISFACEEATN